jgi:hypothetical protein
VLNNLCAKSFLRAVPQGGIFFERFKVGHLEASFENIELSQIFYLEKMINIHQIFFLKPLDKSHLVCYNIDTLKKGINAMKSETYIKKILAEGACSIETTEKLTEALHREGLLHPHLSVRFKFLFGTFDIIETDWLEEKNERPWFYPINEFSNIIATCVQATELYTPYFEAKKKFLKKN